MRTMFLRLCDLSPCPSRAWAGTSTRIELRISGGNVRVFGSIPVGSSGQRAAAGLQVLDQRIIGPFLLQQYRKHIEPGSMAPCSSNQRLNEATHVQQFLAVTGDKDAIDNSTATFRCWNDVFVLGPGCRDAVTKCVPYLTYASWMNASSHPADICVQVEFSLRRIVVAEGVYPNSMQPSCGHVLLVSRLCFC